MITTDRLRALRALCDAATPGEWQVQERALLDYEGVGTALFPTTIYSVEPVSVEYGPLIDRRTYRESDTDPYWRDYPEMRQEDAAFIAAARAALPELLDAVETLQADLRQARHWANFWQVTATRADTKEGRDAQRYLLAHKRRDLEWLPGIPVEEG